MYEVNGSYKEKSLWKKFSKEVNAESEEYAKEKTLCIIGSKHNVRRKDIRIEEVKKVVE